MRARGRALGCAAAAVRSGPVRFHSRTQSSGSFLYRLRKRGTYRLVCTIHARDGQSMILRVR